MGLPLTASGSQSSANWLPDEAIRRIVFSIVAAEYRRLRAKPLSPTLLKDGTFLNEDGIGFDSLATLEVVATVCRLFELHLSGIEDYLFLEPQLGGWVRLIGEHFRQLDKLGLTANLVFETSGSTGTPKQIPHPLWTLWQEIDALLDSGQIPQVSGRILCLVPAHHIYGCLFGALLPSRLGCDAVSFSATNPARALADCTENDLLIATPFLWRILAADPRLSRLGAGVTSGAPMPAELWARLKTQGLPHLTEVYGSSETSGIGLRSATGAPFNLLPHIARIGDDLHKNGAELALQDSLFWQMPRQFTLQGRKDLAVQIGGVNVSYALVRDCLLEVSGVEDAAVRLDAERLKAFIQTRTADTEALEATIRAHLTAKLGAPARPQKLQFGQALPRNSEGKLQDW